MSRKRKSRVRTYARVSHSTKRYVFIRDDNECQNCGSKERLTIDHIVPTCWYKENRLPPWISNKDPNHPDNLQLLCNDCNSAKDDLFIKFYPPLSPEDYLDDCEDVLVDE